MEDREYGCTFGRLDPYSFIDAVELKTKEAF